MHEKPYSQSKLSRPLARQPLSSSPGKPAGRRDRVVGRQSPPGRWRRPPGRRSACRVSRGGGDLVDVGVVALRLAGGTLDPVLGRRPAGEQAASARQAPRGRRRRPAHDECLMASKPAALMPTNLASARNAGPRAGGEVLQPRADGDDDVGVGGEGVRRLAAGDADRPGVQRMGRRAATPCRRPSRRRGC